jgi:hypothetical protein
MSLNDEEIFIDSKNGYKGYSGTFARAQCHNVFRLWYRQVES